MDKWWQWKREEKELIRLVELMELWTCEGYYDAD